MAMQTISQSASQASSGPYPGGVEAELLTSGTELATAGTGKPGESSGVREAAGSPSLRLAAPFERLPVPLSVAVPVREFRVRNLLSIKPGEVIETQWNHGEDLPISSGDVQLAWSEFEVVDTRLAVRVTRLT